MYWVVDSCVAVWSENLAGSEAFQTYCRAGGITSTQAVVLCAGSGTGPKHTALLISGPLFVSMSFELFAFYVCVTV